MPSKKAEPAEGVAPHISNKPDRYEAGVPVSVKSVPADASTSESKSGQKANTTKEKD